MKPYANCAPASKSRVVALCQFCGKRSKPCWPDKDGEPSLFDIGNGWAESPYPHDFKHRDGSVGSLFTCPACNKRLRAGEVLITRGHAWAEANDIVKWPHCATCGLVKRSDGKNKPCRGPSNIELRDFATAKES